MLILIPHNSLIKNKKNVGTYKVCAEFLTPISQKSLLTGKSFKVHGEE